jgi:hypothetical protein
MMARITEVPEETQMIILSTVTTALSTIENKSHIWLIDSAASSHLCGNVDLFDSLRTVIPISIETASGEAFTANQRGTVHITLCSDVSFQLPHLPITLLDVIYAPKLNANLWSVGRMTNANVDVIFSKDHSLLSVDNQIIAHGPKISNLFIYTALATPKATIETARYSNDPPEIKLWHHPLAHTSYSTIKKMIRMKTANRFIPYIRADLTMQCENCPFRKQARAPFKRVEDLPSAIGDIIVSDLCGPFEASIGGYNYFVTWIDLKSWYTSIDFLKNKECATVTESFRLYMAWITRQKKADVKRIRTDNGGEYMGRHICSELGIVHKSTSPYSPEHNGIAERYNRTLQEGTLTLQHNSELSNKFWVSAIHTVNFVRNRVLHSRIGTSPYAAFWGSKPKLDWLRTYGMKCWALVPKAIRRKGGYKSVEGMFVGYFDDSKAYKIWVPRTHSILKAHDTIFDESNHIERVTIHATDDDDLPGLWTDKIHISTSPSHDSSSITWTEDESLPFTPETPAIVPGMKGKGATLKQRPRKKYGRRGRRTERE